MYVTHIWTFIGKFKRDGGGRSGGKQNFDMPPPQKWAT